MTAVHRFCLVLLLLAGFASAESVDFNRDIRPILSDRCFHCHGPDEHDRKGHIRLDITDGPDGAYRTRKGTTGIKPKDLDGSEVWYRIITDDEDDVMPPADSHKKALTEAEKELIRRWILDGAEYQPFWAFAPPKKTSPAPAKNWRRNSIDDYVASAMTKEKLKPSPEADKRTLLRRLSLDLTGLPPTLDELAVFEKDVSKDAYEHAVDRLLASPHYGEQSARYWGDLVRLADTNGMHKDFHREFSPFRDWLIRAFNENLPYDEFVRHQLAGDLYEQPTQDQLVASGFNRMHLIIDRGTALPEESHHKNVLDRVEAFGTAFLGLTVQCSQCHDHKYDPVSQKEFFELYAFFNNFDGLPETRGREARGLQPPFISIANDEQKAELASLTDRKETLQKNLAEHRKKAGGDWYGMAAPAAPWIWEPEKSKAKNLSFKTTLNLAGKPTRAAMRFAANQNIEVWINGKSVGKGNTLKGGIVADVKAFLKSGNNEITAKAQNGHRGFNVELYAEVGGEKVALLGGKHWQMKREGRNTKWEPAAELFAVGTHTDWVKHVKGDSPEGNGLKTELAKIEKQLKALNSRMPGAMVMREKSPPRKTHILVRGAYDKAGDEVSRGTPAFLPPLKPRGDIPDRMDLANWLLTPEHPLTARVAVNRLWQQFFGVGLVKTAEDFGAQGEPPSHPELLDYLTLRFVESGWDMKALVREIVTSATYRQQSDAPSEAYRADPENRKLARGSRYRLDAEVLRDQILAVSGKLNTNMYGMSVKPPQPAGLWKSVSMTGQRFSPDKGDAIYRRSLYTYWKRAMPPPQMTIMNAPSREYCLARRERTNTPLQALLLMNEPEYFKLAQATAKRVLDESGGDRAKSLTRLYERITSQVPSDTRLRELGAALDEYAEYYKARPELVSALEAEAKGNPDLAAWTMLTHGLLNVEMTKVRR